MNKRTKAGFEVLQVALVLGLLGDVLLRAMPWGLNVFLFNLAFTAGAIMLLRRRAPEYLTLQTCALFAAQIFFASMYVVRSSPQLRVADTFAIIAILSILFVPRMQIAASVAGLFHYAVGFLWSSFNAFFAPAMLLTMDIEWKNAPKSRFTKNLYSVLKGVAIVSPLILIFGALFVAADAAYENLVQRTFNVDFSTAFTHIILFSIFSWLSAGYLRGIIIAAPFAAAGAGQTVSDASPLDDELAEDGEKDQSLPGNRSLLEHINISDPPNVETPKTEKVNEEKKRWQWPVIDNTILPSAFTLGSVEVGVILGLTNLLFLSFVIIQVPYLFGGMDLVQNTPDFKLAEYARRGFGELVAVSALVLPMLLVGHWLIRKETPAAEKLFRALAIVKILLLFVIMASAVQRLVLLTGNLGYGLTTIRLYPMIFMSWLAVVFIWFGFTVLRGSRQYFAWGALWTAFVFLGVTHLINPDALIVRTNIALMREGAPFDARYNSQLSDDAIPGLVDAVDELNITDREIVLRQLSKRNCEKQSETDLRSWSIPISLAARSLASASAAYTLNDCSSPAVVTIDSTED